MVLAHPTPPTAPPGLWQDATSRSALGRPWLDITPPPSPQVDHGGLGCVTHLGTVRESCRRRGTAMSVGTVGVVAMFKEGSAFVVRGGRCKPLGLGEVCVDWVGGDSADCKTCAPSLLGSLNAASRARPNNPRGAVSPPLLSPCCSSRSPSHGPASPYRPPLTAPASGRRAAQRSAMVPRTKYPPTARQILARVSLRFAPSPRHGGARAS